MTDKRKPVSSVPDYIVLMASVFASASLSILIAESSKAVLWAAFGISLVVMVIGFGMITARKIDEQA